MGVELLAPAGDFEKFETALNFGADAVYLGGENFGLRKASKNFSNETLKRAVKIAHAVNKKIYITLNVLPHDRDLTGLEDYVTFLYNIGTDAVIVSDLGVMSVLRRVVPKLPVHISTQASVVNSETVKFFYSMGAERVVLARELTFDEIKAIRKAVPSKMELECFVHGAMCISYSGRCLLSNYMTGRDANRGECAHPCRYKYTLMEEKRPGEYFPIYENDNGTFILNSKDLCMIEYIPKLYEAGISSFKREGRVKSSYYTASVLRAYRAAMDDYEREPLLYEFKEDYLTELKKASYRDFTTGFFFGAPEQNYSSSSYIRSYDFCGVVLDYDYESGRVKVEQRNKLSLGDKVEIFGRELSYREEEVLELRDSEGLPMDSTPHPKEIFTMRVRKPCFAGEMIRKLRTKEE